MVDVEYIKIEDNMARTIAVLKDELNTLRAGRANPAILDRIAVDYYGVLTPVKQVSNVSAPESRQILIQPWDVSLLKEIEKAIQKSDIGINPNNDGKVIRLNFPVPTEERRKELAKNARKYGEEGKVAIRAIRREAIEEFKSMKKASDITEDDLKDAEKEIQHITDKYIELISDRINKKEIEILEV